MRREGWQNENNVFSEKGTEKHKHNLVGSWRWEPKKQFEARDLLSRFDMIIEPKVDFNVILGLKGLE